MFCRKLGREISNVRDQRECKACWNSGQKEVWYKRMVEEYGYRPGSGHRAFLLRRDCRANYLTNKPPQEHLTEGDINEAD